MRFPNLSQANEKGGIMNLRYEAKVYKSLKDFS